MQLLFCPDCEGACTVRVRMMVLGTMPPTMTVPPEQETGVAEPPLTDSSQLRRSNFAKSPEETRVALP